MCVEECWFWRLAGLCLLCGGEDKKLSRVGREEKGVYIHFSLSCWPPWPVIIPRSLLSMLSCLALRARSPPLAADFSRMPSSVTRLARIPCLSCLRPRPRQAAASCHLGPWSTRRHGAAESFPGQLERRWPATGGALGTATCWRRLPFTPYDVAEVAGGSGLDVSVASTAVKQQETTPAVSIFYSFLDTICKPVVQPHVSRSMSRGPTAGLGQMPVRWTRLGWGTGSGLASRCRSSGAIWSGDCRHLDSRHPNQDSRDLGRSRGEKEARGKRGLSHSDPDAKCVCPQPGFAGCLDLFVPVCFGGTLTRQATTELTVVSDPAHKPQRGGSGCSADRTPRDANKRRRDTRALPIGQHQRLTATPRTPRREGNTH